MLCNCASLFLEVVNHDVQNMNVAVDICRMIGVHNVNLIAYDVEIKVYLSRLTGHLSISALAITPWQGLL